MCPYKEGKGLVAEGAASEESGLVQACVMEEADLRASVCKLLEAGGTSQICFQLASQNLFFCFQAPMSPTAHSPVGPHCLAMQFVFAMWLDHPSIQLCWFSRAVGELNPPDQFGSWAKRTASSNGIVTTSPAVF